MRDPPGDTRLLRLEGHASGLADYRVIGRGKRRRVGYYGLRVAKQIAFAHLD